MADQSAARENPERKGRMEREVVELSGLGLLNCLPGFVEPLQGELHVDEVRIWADIIPEKAEAFAIFTAAFSCCPCSLYTVPRLPYAAEVTRVALNPLPKCICSFLEFPGDTVIVSRR